MKINYHNKRFAVLENSNNGEVSHDLVFTYEQEGDVLTCKYSGGKIKTGHLLGLVDEEGRIHMNYHQVNLKGELKTGKCLSVPELQDNGLIKLYETWQWTNGDEEKGTSVLLELK